MIGNLALGTAVISITVLIHTVGLIGVTHLMNYVRTWFRLHRHEAGRTMAMIATVLALFFVHSVEVWLWALVYMGIGDSFRYQQRYLFFGNDLCNDRLWRHCSLS